MLDAHTQEAYRRQVAELQREIDEADAFADIERAAARRAEFDTLLEELTQVERPGGRSHAFTDADERTGTSVQKALRRAIAAIGVDAPRITDALTVSIRTGTVCRFDRTTLPSAGTCTSTQIPRKSFARRRTARADCHGVRDL